MRRLLLALLLCSCAVAAAQEAKPLEGPDFTRATRPRGTFYLNGVGHQYLAGKHYTVVAAAVPVLNGKFFGVKIRVFNRGTSSVNVLPETITAEDSVGAKQLALYSSAEVNDKLTAPSTMARLAGYAVGGPPSMGAGSNGPTMADLVQQMLREAAADSPMGYMESSYPTLTPRGPTRATAHSSPACDLGCELRNREIGDGTGPQLPRRPVKPEVIDQSEFLANTVPPGGEVVGMLYFAMPKMTDRAPISRNGRKSYMVTLTVPVGDEKFQFVFPPE
jgi:hypothetical protein